MNLFCGMQPTKRHRKVQLSEVMLSGECNLQESAHESHDLFTYR